MIKKIKENIWQMDFKEFGSAVYFLIIGDKKILIDTSSSDNKQELLNYFLNNIKINPHEVNIIILTHSHYDHIGNIDLFPNAKVYGSRREFGDEVEDINLLGIKELRVIKTPGHTKGSICILYKDILFSGDTIFHMGGVGRTDLPGGNYEELQKSIEELEGIKYRTLCPGHI